MKRMLCIGLVALALTGCSTVPAGTPGTPTPAVSLGTADEKALLAVEASWRATLIAVNAAVDSGQLKGENAAKVRNLLAIAKRGVDAARAAYDAGQTVQLMARVGDAASALGGVRALLGR